MKDFLAIMKAIQDDRSEAVGGHTHEDLIKRYGPAIMFAELASITSRIESMLWDPTDIPLDSINHDRLQDLCVDLANYVSFLWEWSVEEKSVGVQTSFTEAYEVDG